MPESPGVILAMDLGATTLAGGLVDVAGTVSCARTVPTDRLGRGERILQNLLQVITGLRDEAQMRDRPILGIGIGAPGVIQVQTGTIGGDILNIPELQGLALGPFLRDATGLPVVVDNDVNALTLGEWTFGRGRGLRHMAMIAVGTSIGGGLILNGALVRGAKGYGGEIGHITLDMNGPDCDCGSRGCVKVYAGGSDMGKQARALLRADRGSMLLELAGGNPDRIDASRVFAAAAAGDPIAVTVAAKAAQALGAAVASLINLCNPDLVVLGGGVMEAGDILMEPVVRWARFYAFQEAFDQTRIIRSTLKKESAVLGAAALFLYEHGRRKLP